MQFQMRVPLSSLSLSLALCLYYFILFILFFVFFVFHLQFEDIGRHGTKVIIFNLWLNDEGIYELNFDDDDEVFLPASFIKLSFS